MFFLSMDEKTGCFDEIFVCGRKNDGREMITRCRFRVVAGLYGGFSRLFGWSLRPLCPKKSSEPLPRSKAGRKFTACMRFCPSW